MFEGSTFFRPVKSVGDLDHRNTKTRGLAVPQKLHISFADQELVQPHYSLVQLPYYEELSSWVTAAPIFCLQKPLQFAVEIRLDPGMEFVDQGCQLIDASSDQGPLVGSNPLELVRLGPGALIATISLPVGSGWERWIYRLAVCKGTVQGSFYLAFSYLPPTPESLPETGRGDVGDKPRTTATLGKNESPRLFTQIDDFRFLDVFHYDQITTPLDEVRPEPLIILHPRKRTSDELVFAFATEGGFARSSVNDCDSGTLALVCRGVTHQKPCSAAQPYPQGFAHSWVSGDAKVGGFVWSLVEDDASRKVPMVATLQLVVEPGIPETQACQRGLQDPTIIVEPPCSPVDCR